MSGNGSDETPTHNGEGAPLKPTFEEALAAMPRQDRVDRLAAFAAEQSHSLADMFSRWIDFSAEAILGLNARLGAAEAAIAELKATPRPSPGSNGGNGADHGGDPP